MKRIFILCLIMASAILCSSCSTDKEDEKQSSSPSVSFVQSSDEQSSKEEKDLLKESFGSLFASEEYYIETEFTVESSSSTLDFTEYNLIVAADRNNQSAMIDMTMTDGQRAHMLVRNNYSYRIDDEKQTYTKQPYTEDIGELLSLYTKELYLGITEPLIFDSSGKETIKPFADGEEIQADYLRYRMSPEEQSSESADEVFITYYFSGDKPVMEVMEKVGGKTTFVFMNLSEKINDRSVFDINNSYVEAGQEEAL